MQKYFYIDSTLLHYKSCPSEAEDSGSWCFWHLGDVESSIEICEIQQWLMFLLQWSALI